MNSKVAYMQPYYSQVVKKKLIFNLVIVCEEKKIVEGNREIKILFIILLGGLYYFIKLYIKIKIEMWSEL